MSYAADAAKACSHTRERVVMIVQTTEPRMRRQMSTLVSVAVSRLGDFFDRTTRLRMWLHALAASAA